MYFWNAQAWLAQVAAWLPHSTQAVVQEYRQTSLTGYSWSHAGKPAADEFHLKAIAAVH